MSVSDPLIKDIKGCTLKFLEALKDSEHISDSNTCLLKFCQCIEQIFNFGVRPQPNNFGFYKQTHAWHWLEKLGSTRDEPITFSFVNSVDNVQQHRNVQTNTGKLRLLIRYCLTNKCLHVPVDCLIKKQMQCTFYKPNCILGDEILSEILLSVLLQCSRIIFKLDLKNASFLDLSWSIPEILTLELVPCNSLGLSVSFANEKAIIVNVKPNSVISENRKVEVGDVLDNLNGIHICSATRGKLNTIVKTFKGKPIRVVVIKTKFTETNEIYQPIVDLIKLVQIDPDVLRNIYDSKNKESSAAVIKNNSAGFKATYLGTVSVGKHGDVKQIDKAVRTILSPYQFDPESGTKKKWSRKLIYFEVGEMGVKVVDSETSDMILKHSYMEISSCGSVANMPNYFAYVAGNEYCSSADRFDCHVFHIKSADSAYTILQSIGQGFQRTHFAV